MQDLLSITRERLAAEISKDPDMVLYNIRRLFRGISSVTIYHFLLAVS